MMEFDASPTTVSSNGIRRRSAGRIAVSLSAILALLSIFGCNKGPMVEELIEDAQLAIRRNDHKTAQQLLEDALKQQPSNRDALLYRAQLARDMKDDDAALTWLAKIPDEPPKFGSTARFMEGSIYIAMHRSRDAESKFLRSIELNRDYYQPRERLLRLYVLQRRKNDMLNQIDSIARMRLLQMPELSLQLTAGERAFNPIDAIPQLEPFIVADPDDLASQFALAIYYNEGLRPSEAIAILRNILSIEPDNAPARGLLAEFLVDQQDVAGAGRILNAIQLTSNSPDELWNSAGVYFLAREEWKLASHCFAVVAVHNSLDRSVFRRLGLALQRLGEHELAEVALKRTSLIALLREHCETLGIKHARNKLQAKDLVELAGLLADLEEPDRASAWYEQAMNLDRSSVEARAGILALQGRSMKTVATLLSKVPRTDEPIRIQVSNPVPSPKPVVEKSTTISPIQFRDDHEIVGLDFSYFNGASGKKFLIEAMGGGVGVIDFDHDDWPDFFFPQGNDMFTRDPNLETMWHDQLFRNHGGNGFAAVPAHAGIGDPGYGQGVAVGDYNNDGFDDLFVTNYGRCSLLQNRGDGTFHDVTDLAGLTQNEMSTSTGWADFDQDGLLDLFVVNYVDNMKVCQNDRGEISTCSPSNHTGVDDRVYRNLGEGRFEDLTKSCGIVPGGKGLGLVLADFDDDGLVDAIVSNDTTPNFFYRNRSSPGKLRFVEEGLLAGVALGETGIPQAGMGIACGDIDGDQRLDVYITYFYREANGLYLNLGEGTFQEATRSKGLYHSTLNMLGFGTQAVDFDLDGHLELVVANGHIDDQRAIGVPWKMPPQLFVLGGREQFTDQSRNAGDYFRGEYLGRGVARVDWNRDGRPDLVIVHQDRPAALLTNTTESAGRFFELQLRSKNGNRNAIGARVNLTCAGRTQRVDVTSGDGFYCANEQKVVFGVGDSERIDRLEIVWPGGEKDVHFDLPTRTRWIAIQGSTPILKSP